ncbi:MAG: response regulator transcription factor [Bacilli bacterium]|jgi:two-component system response regulator CiaR|nr:response regulator transcription factor [Bacilli bacterium]MDD3121542.1 response regulator transcription factor [Bacilli bacterium]MDD4062813.1 response regulator transcription factor [Bacilli bacterium]MDD4482232.1 response regulator transcription factor [Bacilli bacterium]MDY0363355.1 response regulator transcription factor [Bacilli bacterium]
MKILVVEDDKTLNMSISKMLDKIADIDSVYDGEDALFQCEQDIYDLIILDVMLPHIDGFTILEKLRKFSNCPVLMLTAKTSVNDRVKGLNLGADDYLTKPFFRDELIARVEALLRRYNNNFQGLKLTFKDMEFDVVHKIVRINGNSLDLVGKTYDILEYLVRNKEIIIPKEQLFNRIWGFDSDTVWSVVEVYVSNLRKTLKDFGYNNYLKTIRNVGYMWSEKI